MADTLRPVKPAPAFRPQPPPPGLIPPGIQAAAELAALHGKVPLALRLRALFGANMVANGLFLLAIVIGFFHGWLKLHYRNTLMTFAFDIPVMLALGLALLKLDSMTPWFPPGNRVAGALKSVAILAVVFALLPFGVPFLVSIASFRAWVLVPLVFLLGYHVVRSLRQVEVLLFLVVALCIVTTVYGMRQTPEEVRAMIAANPEIAVRLKGTFFVDTSGAGRLRTFSTFVSAGAFGGTMATGGFVAFFLATEPGRRTWLRLALFGACGLCAYGVTLSGARTALIILMLGIAFVAWSRRQLVRYAVIPGIVGALAAGTSALIDPAVATRLASIFDVDEVWGRFAIVFKPAFQLLLDYPMGGGLGRSSHGVPFILINLLDRFEIRPTDGDLGRIVADFGILGLIAFGVLFYRGVAEAIRWVKQYRDRPLLTCAGCAGGLFMVAVFNVPTGSPFLGVPGGVLVWFLYGAMSRVIEDYAKLEAVNPALALRDPRFLPFGAAPEPEPVDEVDRVVSGDSSIGGPTPPQRRFLFRKNPAAAIPAPAAASDDRSRRPARPRPTSKS